MPYVKVDTEILGSTIWLDRDARDIFLTALLWARPWDFDEATPTLCITSNEPDGWHVPPGWYGFAAVAGTNLVAMAGVEPLEGMRALERLTKPDPASRSPEYDGRRLVRIPAGFIVLNYIKYRDKDYTSADRSRRYRLRKRHTVTPQSHAVTPHQSAVASRNVTHSIEQRADTPSTAVVVPPYSPEVVPRKSIRSPENENRRRTRRPSANSYSEGFCRFWEGYENKVGKGKAWEIWERDALEAKADEIIASLERWRASQRWRDGFVANPATFLGQRRWEDDPPPAKGRRGVLLPREPMAQFTKLPAEEETTDDT